MKTSFIFNKSILLAISLLVVFSCSKNDDDISYDLTGNWKVIYYIENGNKITRTEKNTWADFNNGDITANFTEPDSDGKGTLSGIKVTNIYNGNYTAQTNGKISIGTITSTEINEPEWTRLFNIGSAERFEIKNLTLFIYYNNNINLIAFERN